MALFFLSKGCVWMARIYLLVFLFYLGVKVGESL